MGTRNTAMSLGLGLAAGVVGILLIWLTALGVTRPILGVAAMLKDIASGEGDLTRRLEYAKQDELGELASWFNRFLDKLQPIIADVKRSVQDARSTADQSAADRQPDQRWYAAAIPRSRSGRHCLPGDERHRARCCAQRRTSCRGRTYGRSRQP